MSNIGSSYSQIIQPMDYNHIMSNEHLYIKNSDQFIVKKIKELALPSAEVIELGCGPARVLSLVSEIGVNLTGIDLDSQFLEYAKNLIAKRNIRVIEADVETYRHFKKVDIFYSQGFHHHISKGVKTSNYLENVFDNLRNDGLYILSDEFIPEYKNKKDREIKVVIWYSHIISHAIKYNHLFLAQEEAKTLLDDLFEGRAAENVKSLEQISFVLSKVEAIDKFSRQANLAMATQLTEEFLAELEAYHNLNLHGDLTVDLSRGDYKICDRVLREEVENVNFRIEDVQHFGPVETIGGMSVYILRKG